MLFEFDADQRLLRDTVREVTAKECPPAVIREIVDAGADPGRIWKTYVDLGWTELVEPEASVELGIVLEGLGRATDP
ncbi:MAG: acyl-CoA dehydrogenase, partial [Nocardia sp.]|nr:acyl-CoA dehydrogenase [Nocardia sp.]